MKRIAAALTLAVALALAAPASADSPLPPTLRSAGVTAAQWDALQTQVRATAARTRVSERALASVAERLGLALAEGGRRVDVGEILGQLDALAQRIAELETRLAALARDEDPEIAALITTARAAIQAGDLGAADAALAAARRARADRNALRRAQLESGLLEEAGIIAAQGEVATLRADYLGAAALYAEAAETAPISEAFKRNDYLIQQGEALLLHGERIDSSSLRRAIVAIESAAPPLVDSDFPSTGPIAMQRRRALLLLGQAYLARAEHGSDALEARGDGTFESDLDAYMHLAFARQFLTEIVDTGSRAESPLLAQAYNLLARTYMIEAERTPVSGRGPSARWRRLKRPSGMRPVCRSSR